MNQAMMNLGDAALALNGSTAAPHVEFNRVNTDSRAVEAGELFVALKGERFDAHEFVEQALRDGAAAAMVQSDWQPASSLPLLRVADPHAALGQLSAVWRSRFDIPVVGITGSNGKTTVKEMLTCILVAASEEAAVLATRGNLNNDIGMPLTLLRLEDAHRYAIVEMGMNHPGEISYLTAIARPTVAVINNAQAAHLAGLGDVSAVALAKGEIFEGLAADGIAVINADDPHAALWRDLAGDHARVEFGLDQGDVHTQFKLDVFGSDLSLMTPAGDIDVKLQVPGLHNVRNALAAAAAAIALGIPIRAIARGLTEFNGVKGRLQRKHGKHNALIIDDTYNANPGSVSAALYVLAAQAGDRRFVFGDIGELGDDAAALHAELGALARRLGVNRLYALGEYTREAVKAFGEGATHYESIDALTAALDAGCSSATTILVKGSRFMKMERVVEFLTSTKDK